MDSLKKAPSTAQAKKAMKTQGILILGMHRSGTSACTRVLNLLGCSLPPETYGKGPGNENGHWESIAAVTLNDEILHSAGSRWDDWGPINADWRESSTRVEMTERASEVIRDHAKLGPLFALKDPRLCRLADVWLDAMDEAGVEPLVLTMLRNPVEVAGSLENRDLMSQGYGGLLWLRHVLDAEQLSRGRRRLFCTYDQLLDNWPEMIDRIKTGFGVSFPRNSPAVHDEIDRFLTRNDRHHEQPAEAVNKTYASSDWLRRTWAIFLRWSEHGEDTADHEALSAIRLEFDRSYGTFARLLMHNGLNGEFASASQLRAQLAATLSEAEEAAASAAAAMREAETRADSEVALQAQLTAVNQKAAELEAELETLRASDRQSAVTIAELVGSLSRTQNDIEEEREKHRETGKALAAKEAALVEAAEQIADYVGQLPIAQSTLAQRAEEISQMSSDLLKANASIDTAETVAAFERERYETADARLIATEKQVASLQSQMERQHAEHAAASQKLAAEVSRMARLLLDESKAASAAQSALDSATHELGMRHQEIAGLTARLQEVELAARLAEGARFASETKLTNQFEEIERLTSMLASERQRVHEAEMQARAAENDLEARLNEAEDRARAAESELASRMKHEAALADKARQVKLRATSAEAAQLETERKLANRFAEVVRLTSILSEELTRSQGVEASKNWLHNIARVSNGFPKWWALMPAGWRRKQEYKRYVRHDLFDPQRYLALNSDVAQSGMDALTHYILHGMEEGRRWRD